MGTRLKIILFLLFIGVIYAAETNVSETLYENSDDAIDAAKLLDEIQPAKEALPFVLFKDDYDAYQMPEKLERVVAQNGKMINGTQFVRENSSQQMFFCSHENPEKKCLAYHQFEETQRLRCASEPKPIVEPDEMRIKCGVGDTGNAYILFYQICADDEHEIDPDVIQFYRICLDEKQQKALFTSHDIKSPEMLHAKLLFREREVNYGMMTKNDSRVLNNPAPDNVEAEEELSAQGNTLRPAYKEQKLVPSEDMALASWRKTTFQYMNTQLQHENVIDLWNEIAGYIRSNAIQMYFKNRTKTTVFTGVFDIVADTQEKEDDQISNYWVTLVLTENAATKLIYGISIFANNFIDTEPGHSREKVIKGYCQEDLCIATLTKKFEHIKGQVRCCPLTPQILDLFDLEDDFKIHELYIPNVNVSEDQETLYNGITKEEAVKSIGPIKPNEILPIILISEEYDFTLHFPTSIEHIETKNKRIVKGSKFLGKDPGEQLFFCPQENSDQKCLIPQKFGRFEPLQCSKEAIPVASEVLTGSNKCGANDSGILYKVVYKICPKQEPYLYTALEKEFYEFCYNPTEQKILFTRHEIKSKMLLFSKLLFLERALEYPILKDIELPLSNLPELEEVTPPFTSEEHNDSSWPTNTNESGYKLQKLVPSEDMAFALWKKTTHQYVNVALQHASLIPLWDKINHFIRDDAHYSLLVKGSAMYNFVENSIYTGVFDTQPASKNDAKDQESQKTKIWVKIIYSTTPSLKGVAILMTNFLIPKTNESHSGENPLEQYCPENLCTKDLQNEFERVDGRIRCCRLTYKIRELFGLSEINTEGRLLQIRDITYQEKFKSKLISHSDS